MNFRPITLEIASAAIVCIAALAKLIEDHLSKSSKHTGIFTVVLVVAALSSLVVSIWQAHTNRSERARSAALLTQLQDSLQASRVEASDYERRAENRDSRAALDARSRFERQKRPWLQVPLEATLNHTFCRDSESVDFVIYNRGEGTAVDCRYLVVMNGDSSLMHLERHPASMRADTQLASVPPSEREHLAQTVAWMDTASIAATGDSYVHVCLSYHGLETEVDYYLEQPIYVGSREPARHEVHEQLPSVLDSR